MTHTFLPSSPVSTVHRTHPASQNDSQTKRFSEPHCQFQNGSHLTESSVTNIGISGEPPNPRVRRFEARFGDPSNTRRGHHRFSDRKPRHHGAHPDPLVTSEPRQPVQAPDAQCQSPGSSRPTERPTTKMGDFSDLPDPRVRQFEAPFGGRSDKRQGYHRLFDRKPRGRGGAHPNPSVPSEPPQSLQAPNAQSEFPDGSRPAQRPTTEMGDSSDLPDPRVRQFEAPFGYRSDKRRGYHRFFDRKQKGRGSAHPDPSVTSELRQPQQAPDAQSASPDGSRPTERPTTKMGDLSDLPDPRIRQLEGPFGDRSDKWRAHRQFSYRKLRHRALHPDSLVNSERQQEPQRQPATYSTILQTDHGARRGQRPRMEHPRITNTKTAQQPDRRGGGRRGRGQLHDHTGSNPIFSSPDEERGVPVDSQSPKLTVSCISPNHQSVDFLQEIEHLRLAYPALAIADKEPTVHGPHGLCFSAMLILHPTDPDFPKAVLLPKGLEVTLAFGYCSNALLSLVDNGIHTEIERKSPPPSQPQEQNTHSDGAAVFHSSVPQFRAILGPSQLAPTFNKIVYIQKTKPTLPQCVDRGLKKIFSDVASESRSTYEALKYVDRELLHFFSLCEVSDPVAYQSFVSAQSASVAARPWVQEEQLRLEDALIWYHRVVDPRIKWKRIADHVGGGRTARECAERFQACRKAVLEAQNTEFHASSLPTTLHGCSSDTIYPTDNSFLKTESPPTPVVAEPPTHPPGTAPSASDPHLKTHNPPKHRLSHTLAFASAELRHLTLAQIAFLRFEVVCKRCHTRSQELIKCPQIQCVEKETNGCLDPSSPPPSPEKTVDDAPLTAASSDAQRTAVLKRICRKCQCPWEFEILPQPIFPQPTSTGPSFAQYQVQGCCLLDVLPSDFYLECDTCSTWVLCQHIASGQCRTATCRHCFTEMSMTLGAICANGQPLLSTDALRSPGGLTTATKASGTNKTKDSTQGAFKLGRPLPLNGTCKHYKKSFRWFRFPCCGRAFPCDVCHDTQSDHPHELATRMICGHCSKEQPCTEKRCACGGEVVPSKASHHWEGGKGCRNPVSMSRHDDKKYKLLHRITAQQRQAAQGQRSAGSRLKKTP